MAFSNNVCPMCGCKNIKFQNKHTKTGGRTSYYRTGVKSSWFIPAGQKNYNSNKQYETICLCTKCGYSWTWINPVEYAFWTNVVPKILFVALYIGNIKAIGKVNPVFSIVVFLVMTVLLIKWICNRYKQLIKQGKEQQERQRADLRSDQNTNESNERIAQTEADKANHPTNTTPQIAEPIVTATNTVAQDYTVIHTSPKNPENDYYLIDAARIILATQRVSIGVLQRRLNIGFNHAMRITNQLEAIGVISSNQETRQWRILVTSEYFEKFIVKNI